jgi:hypothetical protein
VPADSFIKSKITKKLCVNIVNFSLPMAIHHKLLSAEPQLKIAVVVFQSRREPLCEPSVFGSTWE